MTRPQVLSTKDDLIITAISTLRGQRWEYQTIADWLNHAGLRQRNGGEWTARGVARREKEHQEPKA